MGPTTKPTRQNRTITVDFHDESTYFQLLSDGKAFVELILAFMLSIGFQLTHKATCTGGGCLTRHSHYARVRLGGLTIWRIQCTSCIGVDLEKQIVLRTNRLMRARNVRCLRSIFWVFRFPGLCTSGSRCRVYAPQ